MRKKKNKRYFSILAKQKPQKRKSRFTFSPRKIIKFSLFFIICFAGYWTYKNPQIIPSVNFNSLFSSNNKAKLKPHEIPRVIVKPEDKSPLPDNIAKEIIKITENLLIKNSDIKLADIAKSIQRKMEFSRVHIFQAKDNEIIITAIRRKPYLKVQVDTMRYLSNQGIIFGIDTFEQTEKLIPLYGVFENRNIPIEREIDNSIKTSKNDKLILLEAVELSKTLLNKKIKIKEIWFKKFRGFYVTLEGDSMEIIFGRKPFTNKVDRLIKILNNLASTGVLSSRIELDYEGKAFIKERKM